MVKGDWTRNCLFIPFYNFGGNMGKIFNVPKIVLEDKNYFIDQNLMYLQALQIRPNQTSCLNNLAHNWDSEVFGC